MYNNENNDFIYQFIPREYLYLTKIKTIKYKEYNIKTDYLINIMHELILKYYFTNDIVHNLWSIILKKKYGKIYNIYIDYICDIKFMFLISNYYSGKKAKTYKLNISLLDVTRYKITDKILLKKYKKDYLYNTFTSKQDSPINIELRKMLIDDLYHIKLDYTESLKWLNKSKDNNTLELNKYFKNISSIDGIKCGYIYYKFDPYGRLHTNFTVLKKHIRENHITIDGNEIIEFDIKNSQPLFFAKYLKENIGEENFNSEVIRYVNCVKNGLIYDEILDKYPNIKTRKEAKVLIYKVLFGDNNDFKSECIYFKGLYPTVYEYIKEFKKQSDSYKNLSHHLQLLESDFIFNKVIFDIKKHFPHIILFTVHDSIICSKQYKEEVGIIFRKYLKEII